MVLYPCVHDLNYIELVEYSKLNKELEKRHIKKSFKTGILYAISDNLQIHPTHVFTMINKEEYQDNELFLRLPKGTYLTLSYTKETEKEQILKFKQAMLDYQITSSFYLNFDVIDDIFHTDSYTCQIQVLMKENNDKEE